MVYALMVDFHRDVEHARPLNDFLEEVHRSFAPGTVAMAYFENHDSPRATQVWRDKYRALLDGDGAARGYWQSVLSPDADSALCMALLKNAQALLVDASAGSAAGTNLTRGMEWGSEWGEDVRTDFENATLLQPALRRQAPHDALTRLYDCVFAQRVAWPELYSGKVYYHRNDADGGDADDRLFAYVRYGAQGALLVVHNFDPARAHSMRLRFDYLQNAIAPHALFDTCEFLQMGPSTPLAGAEDIWHVELSPLQSRLWRLF